MSLTSHSASYPILASRTKFQFRPFRCTSSRRGSVFSSPSRSPRQFRFVFLLAAVHSSRENPMSAEAVGRTPVMRLRELVRLYCILAGNYGEPVALSGFGLTQPETESLFSGYDGVYHTSCFLQFFDGIGEKLS